MKVKVFEVGMLRTNCYILDQGNRAVVIDPGDDADVLINYLKNKEVPYILLTHSHFDHIGAIPHLKRYKNSKIVLHINEVELYEKSEYLAAMYGFQANQMPAPDVLVENESPLVFEGFPEINVLETPGHTPGGLCYIVDDLMFTGDTLFKDSIGRTDLPYADDSKMKESLDKLKKINFNYKIMPGHGESSYLFREIENNPFLM